MTSLSFSPTDDYDLLALVADDYSAPGTVRMGDFRQACWEEALANNGWVRLAPIDPTYSKGNGNKATVYRRWRGWSA